ncbi:MAG: hypothetical protein ACI9R3_005523, partial [Verrucomicrobiales bacterium]
GGEESSDRKFHISDSRVIKHKTRVLVDLSVLTQWPGWPGWPGSFLHFAMDAIGQTRKTSSLLANSLGTHSRCTPRAEGTQVLSAASAQSKPDAP